MAELRAKEADIALLLEGTYPYVSGGVSSWVNQIIRAFPEYRFALVFIGSQPKDYGGVLQAYVFYKSFFIYNRNRNFSAVFCCGKQSFRYIICFIEFTQNLLFFHQFFLFRVHIIVES